MGTVKTYFDLTPEVFPWRDSRAQQIEQRRAELGDLLLFDILLTSGGIREPDTLYPPRDTETFYRLFEAIQSSRYDALKRDCLVYFLLKWYQDGREERFKFDRCIPSQFTALSDAYWSLDSGVDVPRAVSILSDARLNTDYATKIIQAISLMPNSASYVLKYVRTAKPSLTEPHDIELYTLALAEVSLVEAWRYQRTFSEKHPFRPRLLQKLLDWCFTPSVRKNALVQLLAIAMSSYEDQVIQAYATPPSELPAEALETLQNLLCVRHIQAGRYAETIKLDRQFSLASSSKSALQRERAKMVQDLLAALPQVERASLELDLDPDTRPGLIASLSGDLGPANTREWDMSMSWEEIMPVAAPAAKPVVPETVLSASRLGLSQSRTHPVDIPAPVLFATPKAAAPRKSLNGSTTVFPALFQSASGSGSPSVFTSANRVQNAFYKPPPLQISSPMVFEQVPVQPTSGSVPGVQDVEMDEEEIEPEPTEQRDQSLSYSVFQGKPPAVVTAPAPTVTPQTIPMKRAPPGAFTSDDDEHEAEADVSEPVPPPPKASRRSTAAKTKAAPKAKTRSRVKTKDLGRSLPGSLMDSEVEEDEDDDVGPLPEPIVQPAPARRRSSRLSSASVEEKPTTKTRASTGRKRRV